MTGQVNSGAQTVSLPIHGRVFITDRMYRAVQPILADLVSAISSAAKGFSPEPGPVELTPPLDATVQPPRSPSADFESSDVGFRIGPLDNTIKSTMTMPTQIQNQLLVSHVFLAFQINTRQSFAASATAGRLVATNHEFQPTGGRRGCFFQKRGHSSIAHQSWSSPVRTAEFKFFCRCV